MGSQARIYFRSRLSIEGQSPSCEYSHTHGHLSCWCFKFPAYFYFLFSKVQPLYAFHLTCQLFLSFYQNQFSTIGFQTYNLERINRTGPGSLVVKMPKLPPQGAWVQSLGGELISHMPCSMARNKED